LIEDYLTARLTAAEAKQFESNYLTTPEKRLRVELIGRIQRQANHPLTAQVDLLSDGAQVEKTPWWQALAAVFFSNTAARYGLVLATLIIFVGGVFLVNRNSQLRTQLARSNQEKINLEQNEAQLREQLAEQRQRNPEIGKPLDQRREQVRLPDEERDAQWHSQLARAEQEKNRLRQSERQLRAQLSEQQARTEQIAKSLEQANEERRVLDEREGQLRSQIDQAEQQRVRLAQTEEQLRQQLARQQQRTELIAKSLAQAEEERRLLDEEILRRQNANAPRILSLELGAEPARSSLFSLRSNRGQTPVLVISQEARLVRITFKTDTRGFQSYRLRLLSADGTELWTRSEELGDGRAISFYLPATLLNPGYFTFALHLEKTDGGADHRYTVRVARR